VKRREFIGLLGGPASAWPLAARAQESRGLISIAFLGAESASTNQHFFEAFRQEILKRRIPGGARWPTNQPSLFT
jgi:hypothetical protein